MEILIDVPPVFHPLIAWIGQILVRMQWIWAQGVLHATEAAASVGQVLNLPANAVLPLAALLLVFWPIFLSLTMALITAWAWIFWLFTSIVLGLLQVVYATYQFSMISGDIVGLSMLKTYSMMRRALLFYLVLDRQAESAARRGKSRRRYWRQCLEQAMGYEDFLKLRIAPCDEAQVLARAQKSKPVTDAALPPAMNMPRSRSWNTMSSSSPDSVAEEDEEEEDDLTELTRSNTTTPNTTNKKKKKKQIVRKGSFGKLSPREERDNSKEQESCGWLAGAPIDPVIQEELGAKTADLLLTTTARLKETRLAAEEHPDAETASALKYLLSGVVKRNHLQLDDILIANASSIAVTGQYGLTSQTRQVIRAYYEQVQKGLDWLAEGPPIFDVPSTPPLSDSFGASSETAASQAWQSNNNHDLHERINLIRKLKQNMGRTALMLSGGGAQAMYHFGAIRALIESKQYDNIKVISGTSGGSIVAGMCAVKTAEELHAQVCVRTVSSDFPLGSGEMKKRGIRWFPTVWEMGTYWLKHKLLVDSAFFRRTCEYYFSDTTFEEAFERTGKHVCISVSASRANGGTAQRLLLNHISTPHVTIASAVAASCALPGVMAPAKLLTKDSSGVLEPFEVDGVEWIDGSVQADLPFQRISTMFAVTSFIVSQTNFHIVPFLNKAYHPNKKSLYWRLFQTMEWDIRNRALKLSRLGLFPRMFGQDISKVFKQKYHGNLTIVPRFTTMQTFGLKALSNPTAKDMEGYLKYGQIATWPYLNAIRDMIRLETALDDSLARLESRVRTLHPDMDWSCHDDVESIASGSAAHNYNNASSSRVRIIGRPPSGMSSNSDRMLRQKMTSLESENATLRMELENLQRRLGLGNGSGNDAETTITRKDDDGDHANSTKTTPNGALEMETHPDHPDQNVWQVLLKALSAK